MFSFSEFLGPILNQDAIIIVESVIKNMVLISKTPFASKVCPETGSKRTTIKYYSKNSLSVSVMSGMVLNAFYLRQ